MVRHRVELELDAIHASHAIRRNRGIEPRIELLLHLDAPGTLALACSAATTSARIADADTTGWWLLWLLSLSSLVSLVSLAVAGPICTSATVEEVRGFDLADMSDRRE